LNSPSSQLHVHGLYILVLGPLDLANLLAPLQAPEYVPTLTGKSTSRHGGVANFRMVDCYARYLYAARRGNDYSHNGESPTPMSFLRKLYLVLHGTSPVTSRRLCESEIGQFIPPDCDTVVFYYIRTSCLPRQHHRNLLRRRKAVKPVFS
jgi:hypothetical protein